MGDKTFGHGTNLPNCKYIEFKFLVDAANAPTLLPNPQNLYIQSVVRTSQGVYTITLSENYLFHNCTSAELNVNAAAAAWAQPGPIANFGGNSLSALPTVQILILDNTSSVTNPPAQAGGNVFISGTIIVCDSGAV